MFQNVFSTITMTTTTTTTNSTTTAIAPTPSLLHLCSIDSILYHHVLPYLTCQDVGRLELTTSSSCNMNRPCLRLTGDDNQQQDQHHQDQQQQQQQQHHDDENNDEIWKILCHRDFISTTKVFPRGAPIFNNDTQTFELLLQQCDTWKLTYEQWNIWKTWTTSGRKRNRNLTRDEIEDFQEAFFNSTSIGSDDDDGIVGVTTTTTLTTTALIGRDTLHETMRTLGMNPADDEIAELINTVLDSKQDTTDSGSNRIDFDDFLSLMQQVLNLQWQNHHQRNNNGEGGGCDLGRHPIPFLLNAEYGYITRKEIKKYMKLLGQYLSNDELDCMIEEMGGETVDGKITMENFKTEVLF